MAFGAFPAARQRSPMWERRTLRSAVSPLRRRLLLSMADQVVSSASNFVFIVLLARSSPAVSMGRFSLVIAIPLAWVIIQRASCGSLILSSVRSGRFPQTLRLSTRVALWGGLTTMLVTAGTAYLVSTTTAELATSSVIAATAPLLAVQDCGRFAGLARLRHVRVLLSDSLWLGVLAAAAVTTEGSSVIAVYWSAGAGLAALVLIGCIYTRPKPPLVYDHRLRPLMIEGSISAAAPVLAMAIPGLFGLPLVAAALRAAATLFGPVTVMLASLATAGLAEVSRSEARTARTILFGLTAVAVVGTAAWGVFLMALPNRVGHLLMGQTWDLAAQVIPFTTLEVIFIGLCMRYVTRLRAAGMARELLSSRATYVTALAITMACLGMTTTEPQIFAAGLVAAGSIYLVVLKLRSRHVALPYSVGEPTS